MSIQLFVDTNVYLNFYHFSNDELDEIRKLIVLLKGKSIRLYITQQVVDECRRNREIKLKDALKQIDFNFGSRYPSFCKDFPGFSELIETKSKFQNLHKELILYTNKKILELKLEADSVLEQLFLIAETLEVTSEILERARRRITIGNPPGKNNSHGDAINWELILEHYEIFDDLHIVTGDGDYYSLLGDSKINPFLATEYLAKAGANISCYKNLSTFFKKNLPDIKLVEEEEKEQLVQNLINSPNFRTTRINMLKLLGQSNLTEHHVKSVLLACFENTQILWIIKDEDIKDSIWNLYTEYKSILSSEFKQEFDKMWSATFAQQPLIITEDDEFPF